MALAFQYVYATKFSERVADAGALPLHTTLNGSTVQQSNTRELIFKPADVVAFVSRFVTVKPGDLIFTGTPGGVGVFRKPPM